MKRSEKNVACLKNFRHYSRTKLYNEFYVTMLKGAASRDGKSVITDRSLDKVVSISPFC